MIHFLINLLRKLLVKKKLQITKALFLLKFLFVTGEDENDENNQPTEQNGTNQNQNPGENVKFQSSETTVDTQNSVVVNSNNVLMVQTASSFGTIDISKPCYVLNNAPQPVYSTGKILSEQDIMSMPIVVCDDSKQDKQTVNQLIIPGSKYFSTKPFLT